MNAIYKNISIYIILISIFLGCNTNIKSNMTYDAFCKIEKFLNKKDLLKINLINGKTKKGFYNGFDKNFLFTSKEENSDALGTRIEEIKSIENLTKKISWNIRKNAFLNPSSLNESNQIVLDNFIKQSKVEKSISIALKKVILSYATLKYVFFKNLVPLSNEGINQVTCSQNGINFAVISSSMNVYIFLEGDIQFQLYFDNDDLRSTLDYIFFHPFNDNILYTIHNHYKRQICSVHVWKIKKIKELNNNIGTCNVINIFTNYNDNFKNYLGFYEKKKALIFLEINKLKLLNLDNGKILSTQILPNEMDVFTWDYPHISDSNVLLRYKKDGNKMILWNLEQEFGKEIGDFNLKTDKCLHACKFNSNYLALKTDKGLRVLDLRNNSILLIFDQRHISFSLNNHHLAIAFSNSNSNIIQIFCLKSCSLIQEIKLKNGPKFGYILNFFSNNLVCRSYGKNYYPYIYS